MGGSWLPPAGWILQPGWRNLFENIATVQFQHRLLAMLTLLGVVAFWFRTRSVASDGVLNVGLHLLLLVALCQVALGIATLLLHVPVALAATHQAGAVTLLSVVVFINHRLQTGRAPA
jgi:cytochrome c oxidase assembly protein subunit 15